MTIEPFIVKHYSEDERPTLKGNGFDGLGVGENRLEAEQFVEWVNERLQKLVQADGMVTELQALLRRAIAGRK